MNEYRSEGRKSLMGLMDRTASADQTGRTLDILVLSGGGDFGAFGAGILGGDGGGGIEKRGILASWQEK